MTIAQHAIVALCFLSVGSTSLTVPGRAAAALLPVERSHMQGEPSARVVIVAMQNPGYRPNTIFTNLEDLRSPRFQGLRDRYRLDEVVKGEEDEFRRILLLRHWVHQRIVPDPSKPAADEDDALRILDEGPKGGRYHCGHLSKALNAVLNAMGYVTRCIFAGAGEKEGELSGAHGANEVWSNTYCKWIVMDAEHDSHFEKKGMPLSALEIRDEVLKDGGADVNRIQGPERQPVPREKDDSYGRTARTYTFVSFYLDGNRHSIWPQQISSVEVVLDDPFFRMHTWYRGGVKHWAYDAGAFKRVRDRHAIEWTPNVLSVKAEAAGDAVRARIESATPNLKEYQIKRRGASWEHVDSAFELRGPEWHGEYLLRSLNTANVAGPVYRLVIERR